MATASSSGKTGEVVAYEKDGKSVRLVYDTWTPRSHFIVVQHEPKQDADADDFQATYDIIGLFLEEKPQFADEAILSFHRGRWYQQHTRAWHAHLCVLKQHYLKEAKIKIKKFPQNNQWSGAKSIEDGMDTYDKRKRQDYIVHKNTCIQKGISEQSSIVNISLSTFNSKPNEFDLVWTAPAPRIGIIARSPTTSTLASLYTFMSKVRVDAEKELGLKDRNFSNFGCHLCLYVCGQKGTNVTCRRGQILTEDGSLTENSNFVGYIQMDASQYAQWLPHKIKQVWLNAFRASEYLVRT